MVTWNRTFSGPCNSGSPPCWTIKPNATIDTCQTLSVVWRHCKRMLQICLVCHIFNKGKNLSKSWQRIDKLTKNWSLFRNILLSRSHISCFSSLWFVIVSRAISDKIRNALWLYTIRKSLMYEKKKKKLAEINRNGTKIIELYLLLDHRN